MAKVEQRETLPGSRPSKIYVGVIVLAIFVLSLHPLLTESLTTDESASYRYGHQLLFEHSTSRDNHLYDSSKMPISALNTLPEWILTKIAWEPVRSLVAAQLTPHYYRYRYIVIGRVVTVLFSVVLGLLVYGSSKTLFGQSAGLFSLVLYAFCPNILAHSKLVTSDLYAACFIFLAVWCFRRYLHAPTRGNLILSAITLGVAQLTKYTAVHLFPIFFILVLATKGRLIFRQWRIPQSIGAITLRFVSASALFLLVTGLTVNIGFLFENVFVPYKSYPLESQSFAALKPLLGNVPVPFPFAYLHGLDLVKDDDEAGLTFGNLYLLGELQTKPITGWWYYYLVAFSLKSTLGLLALLVLSIFVPRYHTESFLSKEIFLIIPVLYLFLYFSLFFHTQIGLRFILPIYPFLFVYIGRVFSCPGRIVKRVAMFLAGAHVLSSLSYHPHYLSYFNELIGDRKNMYKYLADSNVDWGQDKRYLKVYLEKNRDQNLKVSPDQPTWGRIIVSVNDLVGVHHPEKFKWLRENYQPIDRVAYSYLVYDVPAKRLR